jgi:hypothetical protein
MSQDIYNNELSNFKQKLIFGPVADVANHFLNSIINNNDFHKDLINSLDNVEKRIRMLSDICKKYNSNVVRIPPYGFTQITRVLKRNIVLHNYWSIFDLNFTLSERFADYLINLNSKLFTSKDCDDIKIKLDSKNRTLNMDFDFKIGKLKHINSQHQSTYIHRLITLLSLYRIIRNAFMFHFRNIDEYSFVYSDKEIQDKEKSLKGELENIHSNINNTMNQFKENQNIKNILQGSIQKIESIIEFYKMNQSNNEVFLINDAIYNDLIKIFSVISCTFIFFLDTEKPDIS